MSLNLNTADTQAISRVVPIQKLIAAQAKFGDAFTMIVHGKPAACFGSVKIWDGVEEMWLLIDDRARKMAKTLTKSAIEFVDFRAIAGNLHRLQITVRCEDMRAVRWARAIGFSIDGMMMKYGPDGSDYYLMSRT